MTVSIAIWVLEQEAAWFDRNVEGMNLSGALSFGVLGAVQGSAIAINPYHQIYQQASAFSWVVDDLDYSAKHPVWSKIWPKTGHLTVQHRPLLMFARRGAMRNLAVRVGARAIPYAGWALLILDAWHVGKWIGEKTNPFD